MRGAFTIAARKRVAAVTLPLIRPRAARPPSPKGEGLKRTPLGPEDALRPRFYISKEASYAHCH